MHPIAHFYGQPANGEAPRPHAFADSKSRSITRQSKKQVRRSRSLTGKIRHACDGARVEQATNCPPPPSDSRREGARSTNQGGKGQLGGLIALEARLWSRLRSQVCATVH